MVPIRAAATSGHVDPFGTMIRVCHMISGDLWAGAEAMDYHLLKHLKPYGDIELSAILLNEGKLAERIRALGIPVDVVDEARCGFFRLVSDASKRLKRRAPDIVHSHRYKENILAYLSSRSGKDIRLVSTQHGLPEYHGGNRNGKYRLLQSLNNRLLSKSFRKVIAVSQDVKRTFLTVYGFPGDKVDVILNGTEIPDLSRGRKGPDVFRIGSAGRLFPVKDYPLMVEIAREVRRETDRIRFELAGDGPEMRRIQELVERHGLEETFLLRGFLENLSEFYGSLDLYLNTSLHEGIPMSVLDAMSNGLPVIAPDSGGFGEILTDGIEGYLLEGRDPKAYADRCLRLFRDPALRDSMGSSARARVEREFSNDRMAREYRRMYHDVVHA
jgi:glycosyltransferase involved in cell wall biosynthesis